MYFIVTRESKHQLSNMLISVNMCYLYDRVAAINMVSNQSLRSLYFNQDAALERRCLYRHQTVRQLIRFRKRADTCTFESRLLFKVGDLLVMCYRHTDSSLNSAARKTLCPSLCPCTYNLKKIVTWIDFLLIFDRNENEVHCVQFNMVSNLFLAFISWSEIGYNMIYNSRLVRLVR